MKEFYQMTVEELEEMRRQLEATENNGCIDLFLIPIKRELEERKVGEAQGAAK